MYHIVYHSPKEEFWGMYGQSQTSKYFDVTVYRGKSFNFTSLQFYPVFLVKQIYFILSLNSCSNFRFISSIFSFVTRS